MAGGIAWVLPWGNLINQTDDLNANLWILIGNEILASNHITTPKSLTKLSILTQEVIVAEAH